MKIALIAAASLLACSTSALAVTVTTLDGSQGFVAPAGELGGTGAVSITANTALDADGSLQLSGNRTRVLNGNNYAPTTNYGLANDLVSLTGDYLVTTSSLDGIQSPAFRVYIQNGAQRSELIYEAANNGGYTLGTAAHVTADSLFYQFVTGAGATLVSPGGNYVLKTLADFGDTYSANAFVSAFGVGNGGCPGASTNCATFSALADNLAFTTGAGGTTRVNFAASVSGAVPEPATWAMMLVGFGGMGVAMRRSRKAKGILQIA